MPPGKTRSRGFYGFRVQSFSRFRDCRVKRFRMRSIGVSPWA